ncbi:MAG: LysM peptidoglycan-binding domain-containing protein [Cyclobacteriaceae bacterium]|nr:LysM peptidoglycan-binding domain-containing protein [Cyclobacteriaceae bacterium]
MVSWQRIVWIYFAAFTTLPLGSVAQLPSEADTLSLGTEQELFSDSLIYSAYELPWDVEFIPGDDAPEVIRQRLRALQRSIPLHYHERVHAFINYFTVRDREYTRMIIRRRDLYFPVFEKYLAYYNLPDELKYLSIIESGLNPKAISRARAVGLWQFMYFTGRHYGLHIDGFEDQRMDPELATDAACRYLRDLYNLFNDWELALAAYNAGPGNVKKAIRRSGYKKTFWEIYPYLPRETRAYVPQFVAMVYTMNHLAEHNFLETEREVLPPHDTLRISRAVHFETMAQLTNGCLEDIQRLNPSFVRNVIPDTHRAYTLRIPRYMSASLLENRFAILDSASKAAKTFIQSTPHYGASGTTGRERIVHYVHSGETLSTLAQRYQVRIADIQEWNGLRGTTIRTGQRLHIWVTPSHLPVVAKSTPPPKQTLSGTTYTVQEGDTLWSITRRYEGLTVERLRQLNKLDTNKIYPGQVLVIAD